MSLFAYGSVQLASSAYQRQAHAATSFTHVAMTLGGVRFKFENLAPAIERRTQHTANHSLDRTELHVFLPQRDEVSVVCGRLS